MTDTGSLRGFRRPLWLKRLVWHLNGTAGRSIRWRIKLQGLRYAVGGGVAERVCRGNKYGDHTDCFCDRTRRRLDFIPF